MTKAQPLDRHLGHLDALRGIAILGVFLVHVTFLTYQGGRLNEIGFTGQRGVQLFYMVSAFTLCLSLDSKRPEKFPLSNFYLRRFFRIAPLYYVAILGNILLKHTAPAYSALRNIGHGDLLLGFLFLNGLRPTAINNIVDGGWSIAVETTFYLILPFLFLYFNTVRRTLVLFAISAPVLGYVCHSIAQHQHDLVHEQFFAFLGFPVEFPVFVLGMLAYCIWKEYIGARPHPSARMANLSLLLLLTSFVVYYACLPFTDDTLYFSSFLFLPLILALSIHPWVVLDNRFTRFMGKISYSVYLLQFFVLDLLLWLRGRLEQHPHSTAYEYLYHHWSGLGFGFAVMIFVLVPICTLTWKYIEQPGIRLGRRIIAHREGRSMHGETPLAPSLHTLQRTSNSRDAQF